MWCCRGRSSDDSVEKILPRKEKPSKGLSPYNLGPPKSSSVVSTHPKDPKPVNHDILTFQPIGQSRYTYLSTNPLDSDSAAVYNLGSLTLMSTAQFLFQWWQESAKDVFFFFFFLCSFWMAASLSLVQECCTVCRKRGPLSSPEKCQCQHQAPASGIMMFRFQKQ